ncbi:hypothetical protein L6452_20640 [Arctium lappa]|uniref:Uncharacterized protein n=1 Tax=Arctium lappa TaxID=4217 RepID=A0ACB9BBX9_ARCLA|nr:hypothetical protein L6452_20640 [Arctium lappa]
MFLLLPFILVFLVSYLCSMLFYLSSRLGMIVITAKDDLRRLHCGGQRNTGCWISSSEEKLRRPFLKQPAVYQSGCASHRVRWLEQVSALCSFFLHLPSLFKPPFSLIFFPRMFDVLGLMRARQTEFGGFQDVVDMVKEPAAGDIRGLAGSCPPTRALLGGKGRADSMSTCLQRYGGVRS